MEAIDVLASLEILAADQWGVITAKQAEREGISRLWLSRLVKREYLTRARRGVYLLPSFSSDSQSDLKVAWISLVPEKFLDERWQQSNKLVVSHESAAEVHGIGDLISQQFTFSAEERKQSSQADIRIYTHRLLPDSDVVNVDGLPVTSVERTVLDLAEQKIEFNYLARYVVEALEKQGVGFVAFRRRLNAVASSYGFKSGSELIDSALAEAGATEDLEDAVLRGNAASDVLAALAESHREYLQKRPEKCACSGI
ncbi:type IV toxin-antitoxin system AbiEi family antitoxin domain-containing protein [Corynebacterium phocae]|uniref:type IV toxin-antitoxin system AbiEi family antitoxin domain-containing protein n=1 Tax=Corynebacterium phocae TaxID=161895 RepID=UPI001470EE14|nr:type IV toxin-antitoxin system AbiEi family antitoxin domain-containing protein [Corynebacterium phocae]